ncbi:MAG: hypothetical protein AB7U44_00365 [Sulfuricurvum sp.]
MLKRWKINALIPFPLLQIAPHDINTGGLPKQLQWQSRVISTTKSINEIQINLKQVKPPEYWQVSHYGNITESAEIQLILYAHDSNMALDNIKEILEDICDDLSFQLQLPIPIYQLEVIDISEPLTIGEEREIILFPYPQGYKYSKFESSTYINATSTLIYPSLNVNFDHLNNRSKALLRWYHKALAAISEADKFIFLMICLEILCEDYTEQVKAPYQASCGHEIAQCPECGASTERIVNGPTLKKYLIEKLSMTKEMARDTWKLRQIVHGNNDLSEKNAKKIPEVCRALNYSVILGIKQKIGIDSTLPPFFSIDGGIISSQFAICGSRKISDEDL